MLTIDEDFDLKIPIRAVDFELNVSDTRYNIHFQTTTENGVESVDNNYEQFLADVWVGVVLTLMVLSCVCFMCSCLIYHKFQQWKNRVLQSRNAANIESIGGESDLPSYTIASGLPSYEEALEQLKKVKNNLKTQEWTPTTPPTPTLACAPMSPATLSVVQLLPVTFKNENAVKS